MRTILAVLAAGASVLAANPVTEWNSIATAECATAGIDPLNETRVLAITHIAIHDALNAADRRYEPYAYRATTADASPEAAIAAAARDTLVALLPSRKAGVEAAYIQALANIPDGPHEQRGIEAGRAAAAVILTLRDRDGADRNVVVLPGTKPGEYRPTPPDLTPAALGAWGDVLPFALKQASQFRPRSPYKLGSAAYAADFNEVKMIGSAAAPARTDEQSLIARYWYENSGQGWNRVARAAAAPRQLDAWQAARLFALVNIALADGFIAGFEAKYHYKFWRPVTGIREGEADGNPATSADLNWTPYLFTPPVPDYPSTHSVLGGAGAAVLARFFGTDFISFEMTSGAPFANLTRRFYSFSQAAEENAASRILAGIHFRNATRAGADQGYAIGDYVWSTMLRPAY